MEGSPDCRCLRDAGPGPERAQPRGFPSRILLPVVICVSITPGQGSQTEGLSTKGPRAQLPLSLGNITAFQCRSHFKLISLCIMFFKSFLNKTEIQSCVFFLGCGNKDEVLGEQGGAPQISPARPAEGATPLGSLWYMEPHWDCQEA